MDSLVSTSNMSGNSPTVSSAQRTKIIGSEDSLSRLPEEVLLRILSFFSVRDLGNSCSISRMWRRIASDQSLWNVLDLTRIFPSLKVFDGSNWARYFDLTSYGLSIENEPIDNRTFIPILKQSLASLPVEDNAGVTLLTIPKGLTLNNLRELVSSATERNIFSYIYPYLLKEIGDISVDKTYRILITNTILEGSRSLSVSKQKDLVDKLGCERPKVLEVVALLVATFISSGQRLYSNNLLTFTRCEEQVGGYQMVLVVLPLMASVSTVATSSSPTRAPLVLCGSSKTFL